MAQRVKTDFTLFWTIICMVCFGLVMVYSSSSVMAELKYKSSTHFIVRQLGWAAISFFVLMYCKRYDYRALRNPKVAFGALGVVLVLLIVVYFADPHTHRWFRSPAGSIQPSEFAKPALILFLAYFMAGRAQDGVNNKYTLAQGGLSLIVLAVAVALPDLGTAIVLVLTAGIVFFVAGLQWRYVLSAVALLFLLAGAAVISKPYRLARVVSMVDPDFAVLDAVDPGGKVKRYMSESDTTRDATYQPRQARIAVGSGGFLGLGLMESKQKWLFLPEAHTDYIYAIVAEELGFFGCTAILAGFLIILWRGLQLYWTAPDDFGRYLALGVTASIVIQAMINMSVVLGLGPTKGIPLPMISSGGSSLLSTLMCLGLVLSVSEQSSS
jgi:cell division protein FtsW